MVDAHCHVDLFPDPKSLLKESDALGIYTIAVTNLPSHFKMGFAHITPYKKTRLALGMHPLHAMHHVEQMPLFRECLNQTSYIGEIGLDFSKDGIETKTTQLNTFYEILELLKGRPKILSLHSRKAEDTVYQSLVKHSIRNAIFHWYTGSAKLIPVIAESGYFFSVNTAMLNSVSGRELIKSIPLRNILTESDGPFVQLKGRSAKPSDMAELEKQIAALKKIPTEQVVKIINNNFLSIITSVTNKHE